MDRTTRNNVRRDLNVFREDAEAEAAAAAGPSTEARPILGIDLGTSTSAIAALIDGRPELLQDDQGDRIVPSVVQLTSSFSFVVGSAAKHSAITYHDRTVQEVKRLMGTKELIKLGTRTYRPEEISAQILGHLKRAAEVKYGAGLVKDVVLSVPARFENDAREATRKAAEIVGLNVLRLINEPTAAALSYGLDRLDKNQTILVFDFGGGTLDVTVLELFDGVLDVKTSVGDDRLGGKDVDELLIKLFREKYTEQHEGAKLPSQSRDRKLAQLLKEQAEHYKKQLSFVPAVPVEIPYMTHDGGISFELTREALEEMLEEMLLRAMTLVNEALARARLRWEEIDVVLPVGGSSRLHIFRRALEAAWGRPVRDYDNPDEAVARGAAVAAGIERRAFEDSQRNIMILDVSPHRLGVAAIKQVGPGQFIEDYFSEILPKDIKLPATQRREYGALFGGRDMPISIRIYEATNDSNLCEDHRLIAELPLRRLRSGAASATASESANGASGALVANETEDNEMVQVEFKYTLDGTLDVDAKYINAPVVRVQGSFEVAGGAVTDPIPGSGVLAAVAADAASAGAGANALIAQAMARWREAPNADLCAPLLDQAERLINERPDVIVTVRGASDAVKFALIAGDEREVRQKLDALTDLLFELI
jgi:molecular chaperone DnaK